MAENPGRNIDIAKSEGPSKPLPPPATTLETTEQLLIRGNRRTPNMDRRRLGDFFGGTLGATLEESTNDAGVTVFEFPGKNGS